MISASESSASRLSPRSEEAVSALQRLVDGELEAVIIEAGEFYVQFAKGGPAVLRVEAVEDTNLPTPLSFLQRRGLDYRGFHSPSSERSAGNHYRDMAADPRATAELAFQVLTAIYDVPAEDICVTTV